MMTTQYLEEHNLYMAIPVVNGRESPHEEFLFAEEWEMAEFVQAYLRNPYAAMYAYAVRSSANHMEATYV